MITPQAKASFAEQVLETLTTLAGVLGKAEQPMVVTSQTVFLRDPGTQSECEQILRRYYGPTPPVTNFVMQPPCSGAALALEAWAIGGRDVRIERFGPHLTAVSYDGVRWLHCAGVRPRIRDGGVYAHTSDVLEQMQKLLAQAGSGFEQTVRTWFYLGGITESEDGVQRYMELNRARADFYRDVKFNCSLPVPSIPHGIYPASTGIGMAGRGLVAGCVAVRTERPDVFVLPLENPQQTPAYAYHPKYSPQSPKFSRAKAMVLGSYVITWISGTASVVHSESRHPGSVEQQTEQTIDNIEQLLMPANFAFHGIRRAGAQLRDLAKIRVYLKRAEDFARCQAICERRLGAVPAIYAVADICRPELLVEIEGVAFSRYSPAR